VVAERLARGLVALAGAAFLVLLAPAPSGAQEAGGGSTATDLESALPAEWRGSCDLVVLTSDEGGQPVGGVEVSLRLGDAPSVLRGLVTDAEGRAAISGLAAGEWQVELRRDGFMLYTAYLKLEAGQPPELGFKSRQRTGSFWASLEAVFLGSGDRVTPGVRAGRVSAREAEKEAERARRREEQASRREERRVEQGRAARLVTPEEPAVPDDERAPAERAGVEAPESRVESRARASEPEAARVEQPASAAVSPAPPVATTEPGPETAPAEPLPAGPLPARAEAATDAPPTAAPAGDVAPAAPRLLPNPDLLPAGACPECRPGEWSVATQASAAPGGACGGASPQPVLERVAAALGEHLGDPLAGYAGALWATDGNDALRLLPDAVELELRAALEPLAGAGTSCPVVALVIPEGARYVGFRYAAGQQRSGMAECPPGQGCLIGQASWQGNPEIAPAGALKVVWARFENVNPQRVRVPRLTVYFEPARGWLPPPSR
jgi:hypothetical protein